MRIVSIAAIRLNNGLVRHITFRPCDDVVPCPVLIIRQTIRIIMVVALVTASPASINFARDVIIRKSIPRLSEGVDTAIIILHRDGSLTTDEKFRGRRWG